MLQRCSVVLVGPMFGGNVGATARAIKNTGLGELRLVAPVYQDQTEAVMFSHGAEEVLEGARRFDQLGPAIAQCTRIVGFTVRRRHKRNMKSLRAFATEWVDTALQEEQPSALLFGRERDGLSNEELDHCTDLVWIPAHPEHPSYNLSQAVLLVGYELLMAQLESDPNRPRVKPRQTKSPSPTRLASSEELEGLYAHLRTAVLDIGYAYPHTVEQVMRSLREVLSRTGLHSREVQMLRGLARQMMWAAAQIESRRESSQGEEA